MHLLTSATFGMQAAEALVTARSLYRQGERMQALKLLEQVDLEVRAEIRWVHYYDIDCTVEPPCLLTTTKSFLTLHVIPAMHSATTEEKIATLYNMGCCHTAFGDIESAQVNLRGIVVFSAHNHKTCWIPKT
eukprot:165920-Prorocentrum_minimum.AAC.4